MKFMLGAWRGMWRVGSACRWVCRGSPICRGTHSFTARGVWRVVYMHGYPQSHPWVVQSIAHTQGLGVCGGSLMCKGTHSPVESKFRPASFVLNCVFAGTAISLIITICVVIYLNLKQIIPTQLCSPFIDPTDSIAAVRFVTIVVAVLQISAFLFIVIMYFQLLQFMTKVKQQMLIKSKLMSRGLVTQLLLVTVSNLAGWFPSSLIFLASLFQSKYPVNLLIWTTIMALPINSIINPLIFLLLSRTNSSSRTKRRTISSATRSSP